ncbi:MAG: ribosome maturation factor RimP [Acidimicrobiia bacterium]
MASVAEQARQVVEPLLSRLGLELVDTEVLGTGKTRVLRLTVDRQGGIDVEALSSASQVISPALESLTVLEGAYSLEVSSPGVERTLNRPEDFSRFVGTVVSVKTFVAVDGARRHRGTLAGADAEGISLEGDGQPRRFAYSEIARARTVFEWGPAPKPGSARGRAAGKSVKGGTP